MSLVARALAVLGLAFGRSLLGYFPLWKTEKATPRKSTNTANRSHQTSEHKVIYPTWTSAIGEGRTTERKHHRDAQAPEALLQLLRRCWHHRTVNQSTFSELPRQRAGPPPRWTGELASKSLGVESCIALCDLLCVKFSVRREVDLEARSYLEAVVKMVVFPFVDSPDFVPEFVDTGWRRVRENRPRRVAL